MTAPQVSVPTPEPHGASAGDTVPAPPQVWLPVAEAAERTSVSESALRKWIKAGELATREAPDLAVFAPR